MSLDWTNAIPTKPGIYWVTDAPVLRNLGMKKVDLVKVFWVEEYMEYDKAPTLCVGVRGWYECLIGFVSRSPDFRKPRWIGPMEVPDA
jgi:hypothetical protein